ncbi:YidC/Oxa1 family membrane protein insertase [Xanthomonas sp. XNM01]|uniref:YidC/Oxa1 family membrane protein insertase n=1 Tax=Xanthomonas sp. XNM01 TaxID=2769289 RepID=UPI00177DEDE0|nr:YidC/Oxa1 family membrane protein insertase [Xanthomonas sp. XNM01]MBD9369455.1 YidC/Oxa1 family membrane protein insertase [Xanthomonas sp. XNM01]
MIEVLDILLLQPLLVIYQAIFDFWRDVGSNLGLGLGVGGRIILFSITINLLLLPLYREMELRLARGREKRERVARDVARMKAHFRGRERYFYIRTVHRQHRHHPLQALLSSADLFVQILVFATVYRFLSADGLLDGAAFGQIDDLSLPDGLLGGVNVLPLLMTAINAVVVFGYVRDRTRRAQGIALSLLFLVLLYASPAGLVLYWTINNLWSLLRNMVVRMQETKRAPLWMS